MSLTLEIRSSLESVSAEQWNALNNDGNPFVRYEFLYGLEVTDCLGAEKGWYPQYFLLWQETESSADVEDDFGELVAAMPTYIKTHSYGEFVFDWAWAEAYQRHGDDYYPKLICAVPFTPATGPRLLVRDDQPFEAIVNVLVNTACQFANDQKFSSVHWLFTNPKDCMALCGSTERLPNGEMNLMDKPSADDYRFKAMMDKAQQETETHANSDPESEAEAESSAQAKKPQLLRRMDCQYHWQNNGYQSFDDFLSQCTSKRRKTLRRERRYVTDAGIRLERRSGSSLSEQEWRWVHEFYEATFELKWGNPSLTREFFIRMGSTFGENTLIVFAYDPNDEQPEVPVACSIMFHGGNCLYGRFWGCRKEHHCLHFEACYYQGIEHCIEKNITRFEPGAQGEHKITRGFVPTLTESAHYIVHSGFCDAIQRYLAEEKIHVRQRCTGLSDLLPFKSTITAPHDHANSVHIT